MSKQVIEDAKNAYNAWKETQPGSYLERTLANSIVADIVPALIHVAQRKPQPLGYAVEGVDLETMTELALDETGPNEEEDDE